MDEKDYKAIAKIIKEVNDYESDDQEGDIAKGLADYFEKEDAKEFMERVGRPPLPINRKFNRKQFLKDCGIE